MPEHRPRRFDLIAFDWDGTLFDSTAIIVRSIQDAVRDVGGAVPSDEAAAWVIGMALEPALAHAAVEALDGRTACLLSNHGMICHGASLRAAVDAAIRLEVLARQYLIAASVRPPRLLDEAELAAARERYKTYGNKAARTGDPTGAAIAIKGD